MPLETEGNTELTQHSMLDRGLAVLKNQMDPQSISHYGALRELTGIGKLN